MKLLTAVATSTFLLLTTTVSVTAQKACKTGVEGGCPAGYMCSAPLGSEPGAPGICAKICTAGTLDPCPKDYMCYVNGDMPGESGMCVKTSRCVPEKDVNHALNNVRTETILMTYPVLDHVYKELFQQVFRWKKDPQVCNPTAKVMCKGADEFCLMPPEDDDLAFPGTCFKHVPGSGYCHINGPAGECGDGMMCMGPVNATSGFGECVPSDTKRCMAGVAKPCAKGYTCDPLTNMPGGSGYCKKDTPCDSVNEESESLMFWLHNDAWKSYFWDLNAAHKAKVRKALMD